MAGYKLQGKTAGGTMVDIPLAATYDAAGNDIQQHYAAKTEYEAIMAKLEAVSGKVNLLVENDILEYASWDAIDKSARAGVANTKWKVGDEKSVTLSTGEKITLVILGFNHDDLSDNSGKAGITFGLKNCLSTSYPMNASSTNTGGWAGSVMRTTTMATLYDYLPEEVKAVIKPVNKLTGRYDNSGAIETTSDKLFLFSMEEVMGTNKWTTTSQLSFAGEGNQYSYFKWAKIPKPNSGTGEFTVLSNTGCFYTTDTAVANGYNNRFNQAKSTSTNRYYNFNNAKAQGDSATTSCYWWLRSPCYDYGHFFCYVTSVGDSSYGSADYGYGVAFGFCV